MGKIPLSDIVELFDTLTDKSAGGLKLSNKKAFLIIHYMGNLGIIQDTIAQCCSCGSIFDMDSSGLYWESKCRFYCDGCSYKVPRNYDKGKR